MKSKIICSIIVNLFINELLFANNVDTGWMIFK